VIGQAAGDRQGCADGIMYARPKESIHHHISN
jgi:hypothetical protein